MMNEDNNTLSAVEKDLQRYLCGRLEYVMDAVESDLSRRKQEEARAELKERNSDVGYWLAQGSTNVMASMAGAPVPAFSTTAAGKWNGKTTSDYVLQVSNNIAADPQFQSIRDSWRRAYVRENGQESYDRLCKELGTDAATLYVGDRVDEHVLDTLAERRVPSTSIEYVVNKGVSLSFLQMTQDETDTLIAARAETKYDPGSGEKLAARITGAVLDAAPLLNPVTASVASATASVATFATLDFAIDRFSMSHQGQWQTVSSYISAHMSDKGENYLSELQQTAKADADVMAAAAADRRELESSHSFPFQSWDVRRPAFSAAASDDHLPFDRKSSIESIFSKYQRTEPVRSPEGANQSPAAAVETRQEQQSSHSEKGEYDREATETQTSEETVVNRESDSWPSAISHALESGQLGDLGQSMLENMGQNVSGSAIANLPETIFGFLSGRQQSFKMKDNIIPLACLFCAAGMKGSPALRLLLLLFGGGMILRNASSAYQQDSRPIASQPSLSSGSSVKSVAAEYKQYEDEPLSSSFRDAPVIRNGALEANISGRIYHVPLTPVLLDAYEKGAVPLNTLANAVLHRIEQQESESQQRFSQLSAAQAADAQMKLR